MMMIAKLSWLWSFFYLAVLQRQSLELSLAAFR